MKQSSKDNRRFDNILVWHGNNSQPILIHPVIPAVNPWNSGI
ncbi:hypothetical protein [Coleofasciculus sp. G2-EDA-02]